MPVTYGSYVKQLKLLPLVLEAEGGAVLTIRYGYVGADGNFQPNTTQQYQFQPEEVQSILDTSPIPGMSRRDDLSFALYQYLVQTGKIPAGEIT